MRAAIYARISRDTEGDGLGVERQREDCRVLCARRGWSVVGEYVDNDISAYSGRLRPGYQRLCEDIRAGQLQVVVAWTPERLHRSPRELEDFLELIESTGTGVETVKAGVWDVSTSHGRLVARMLGAVSRAESERLGERVHRAHLQARQQGLWRGAIPLGMRPSAVKGRIEPDPAQAGLVEEIFVRITRGESLHGIARELNERGLKPRRGPRWEHTSVDRLIASPALGGLIRVDGELRPAAFDGVVSAEEWHAAQAALRRRPHGERRRPPEKLTLLGGILRCAEHGFVCYGGGKDHAAVYGAAGPGKCYVSIVRSAADEVLKSLIVRRLQQPDAEDLLLIHHDTRKIDIEVAELHRRREEIVELLGEGLLTAATARPKLSVIAERLAELEAQRTPPRFDPEAIIDPEAAWDKWTVPQRREIVRLLFDDVTVAHVGFHNGCRVNPARIKVAWAGQTAVA